MTPDQVRRLFSEPVTREESRARAELVGRWLGVPGCKACGALWIHTDFAGEPVVVLTFCTVCGKIQNGR